MSDRDHHMRLQRFSAHSILCAAALSLASCGGGDERKQRENLQRAGIVDEDRATIWDLFGNRDDPNTTVRVNGYIWRAALEVLDFLPIQAVDPFTGVIVTGYGRPAGGAVAWRATVLVNDPALDARSLHLSLERQGGGTVDADTVRAVENAILTRARQLRIGADGF